MSKENIIDNTWNEVLNSLNAAEKAEKDSKTKLEQTIAEKEKETENLENYIEKLNEDGFLDSLEKGEVFDSFFFDKISQKDAILEYLSKGSKRVSEELYGSYTNVIEARTEGHKKDLLDALN